MYDISMLITPDIQVYKNKDSKRPKYQNMSNFDTGVSYETRVSLDVHTGTHIDRPLHMIDKGATINSLDISRLICKAKVFDMTKIENRYIGLADIQNLDIEAGDFVIFKTINSNTENFDFEFVYLNKEAAKYLVDKKINGVGIDALGIERAQADHLTHIQLLEADIIILEGCRLKDVPAGEYELIALPIKLDQTEGAWVRAVLR